MTNAEDNDVKLPPPAADPLADVPPLVTAILTKQEDKDAALKLVADSIAQQQAEASMAMIFHPVVLAIYVVVIGIMTQFVYKDMSDTGIWLSTAAGLTMAGLVVVRNFTHSYVEEAEKTTYKFAENEDGEEDIIIGSRYGEEIIGALFLRLERNGSSSSTPAGTKKKGTKTTKSTGGKALVRAWTVRVRYRGKGVGAELLEEAVKTKTENLGSAAEIGFAQEHANSKMFMPNYFNARFRKRDIRAAKALEKVVESIDGAKKKR